MNAHRLSAEALTAAQAAGNGTLLDNFKDIHHEVHRRAVEGNRCAQVQISGTWDPCLCSTLSIEHVCDPFRFTRLTMKRSAE